MPLPGIQGHIRSRVSPGPQRLDHVESGLVRFDLVNRGLWGEPNLID